MYHPCAPLCLTQPRPPATYLRCTSLAFKTLSGALLMAPVPPMSSFCAKISAGLDCPVPSCRNTLCIQTPCIQRQLRVLRSSWPEQVVSQGQGTLVRGRMQTISVASRVREAPRGVRAVQVQVRVVRHGVTACEVTPRPVQVPMMVVWLLLRHLLSPEASVSSAPKSLGP